MSNRKLVSSEVAPRVGMPRKGLINWLVRHPQFKPAERLPNGDFLWSEEEITAVVEFRAKRRARKKP